MDTRTTEKENKSDYVEDEPNELIRQAAESQYDQELRREEEENENDSCLARYFRCLFRAKTEPEPESFVEPLLNNRNRW